MTMIASLLLESLRQIGVFDIPGEVIRNGDPLPTHETWHQLNYYQKVQAKERVEEIRRSSDRLLLRHGYERTDGRYSCLHPNQDKIAVFCHRAIGLTWLGHLLDIPISLMWSGFWMPPSSVTTVVLEQRRTGGRRQDASALGILRIYGNKI